MFFLIYGGRYDAEIVLNVQTANVATPEWNDVVNVPLNAGESCA
jgi:hypothetical protein